MLLPNPSTIADAKKYSLAGTRGSARVTQIQLRIPAAKLNRGTPMKELEKRLEELKGSATLWEEQNDQLPKPTTAPRD